MSKLIVKSLTNYNNRLYYTTITIIKKPFNFKNEMHRHIYYELIKTIRLMVNNNDSDQNILMFIHFYMNAFFYNVFGYKENESIYRAKSRTRDFKNILNNINNLVSIENYLDIGCSSGTITKSIGAMLNLSSDNIYGIDLKCPKNSLGFNFKLSKNNRFDIESSSICLVSLLMVLHHVENLDDFLKELYRIMKPGGILIIREHDIDGENDVDGRTFLNILHYFYGLAWVKTGEIEDDKFIEKFYANYNKKEYWTILLEQYNFERLGAGDTKGGYNNEYLNSLYNASDIVREYYNNSNRRNKIVNPYHFYYGVYQKKF